MKPLMILRFSSIGAVPWSQLPYFCEAVEMNKFKQLGTIQDLETHKPADKTIHFLLNIKRGASLLSFVIVNLLILQKIPK
jgi:hypothetical protein